MNLSQKILQILADGNVASFTAKQLCGWLNTQSKTEREIVKSALEILAKECKIYFDEKQRRYVVVEEKHFGKAVFQGNKRGFGFLLVEGGDLFVPASKTNGAFHGDTVLYRKVPNTEDEAEILAVVARNPQNVVGTYQKNGHLRFLLPDDQHFATDIFIQPKRDLNAKDGQKVVVKINVYPEDNRNCPEGEIIQVLGYPNQNNVDLLSVAYAYGVQADFSDGCIARANKLPQTVTEKDLVGRKDLRKECIFTIDGADAKDLDDAVSIVKNGDGTFTLGVHIADVSHYVKPLDEIDKQAFERGTSVYFPNMVFPMLPTELSNGVCSLYEGVDRLTLTCQMQLNAKGNVIGYEIFPSVIKSCHRLTYDDVQAIFDGDQALCNKYEDIVGDLQSMRQLAEILQQKRLKRGNIEFSTKEVTFVTNQKGEVVDVIPFERTFAHQLIEEFMIVANETVAQYAQDCAYPFVYRVHEKPDPEKLAILMDLMAGVGIKVKRSQEIHNSILQDALLQAQQTPYFQLINDVMLRTMQKAKYQTNNVGHFGLASRCYCHFTSPIRRYADLVAHRVLKTAVAGKMTEKAVNAYLDMTENASAQASKRERNADEAERKADDVLKCKYASKHVGETFDAIISGVTERGIFAQLPNTVEGFVAVDKLGGRFEYNQQRFSLSNGSVTYRLGDAVKITVASVNKSAYKIDFDLATE